MRENVRKNNGVTLVALIITIIIMLILAGVALSALTSGEGLFNKVKDAKALHDDAARDENDMYNDLIGKFDEYDNKKYIKLGSINKYTNSNNNVFEPIISYDTYFYGIDENNNFYYSDKIYINIEDQDPSELEYTVFRHENTHLKLTKKVEGIKVSNVIDQFLMDLDGKLYFFFDNVSNYQALFDGKEFQNKYYTNSYDILCILGKDNKIYQVNYEPNFEMPSINLEYDGLEFKDIQNSYALSINNDCYDLYYGCSESSILSFSEISNLGEIIFFNNNSCLDSNGDIYYRSRYISPSNFTKMNGNVKIKDVVEGTCDYPIFESEDGTLYYLIGYSNIFQSLGKKREDIEYIYTDTYLATLIYKDGTTSQEYLNEELEKNNLKILRWTSGLRTNNF